MENFQEKFAVTIKNIYLNIFKDPIEYTIQNFLKFFEDKNVLYKKKSFALIEIEQEWKTTEEAFIWSRSVKILTEFEIEEIIFVVLELKGYTNLNFWLNFPRENFSINGEPLKSLDLTYEITDDMKVKFGLDKILTQPFKLEN